MKRGGGGGESVLNCGLRGQLREDMPQPHDKILKIKQSLTFVVALLQLQLLDFVAIKLFGKLGHMEKNSYKLSERFRI